MSPADILFHAHEQINVARRIATLLSNPDYYHLYTEANYETLKKFIHMGDFHGLESWIKKQSLEFMSVRDLRRLASTYSVEAYHLMRKDELIEAISNERDNQQNQRPVGTNA